MASPRRLAYRDRFVWELEQVVSSMFDDCNDFTNRFEFPDMDTKVPILLSLSQAEFTTLYSAVLTGADLSYPETSHDVEMLFLQGVMCPVNDFCAAMVQCLLSSSTFQDALLSFLSQNGYTGGIGDGSAPLSEEITGQNLLPAGYVCTDDAAFGMALAVVNAINDATTEVLQAIEVLTNPLEIAAELGDNVPGVGVLASAGDVAAWIQNTAQEEYELAWSATVRDQLACDLWCEFKLGCSLTYDSIWNTYLSAALATPPSGVLLTDWLAWLIALPFTASKSTVATVSLLGLLAMRYGGSFGDFALGIQSMQTVIKLAEDDTSSDWSTVCAACATTWCVSIQPGDVNVSFGLGRDGMYYDATGWHGNNPAENDFVQLSLTFVSTAFTQTRIEIDFTTNGNRQFQQTDGYEFQTTGEYFNNDEYPAGLQTKTIVSSDVGNYTIFAGDYATVHAIRIYGEDTNPFDSPAC